MQVTMKRITISSNSNKINVKYTMNEVSHHVKERSMLCAELIRNATLNIVCKSLFLVMGEELYIRILAPNS